MKQSPITIGDIAAYGQMIIVFCRTCTHHKSMDPATLVPEQLKPDIELTKLEGRFQCTRCGGTDTGAELKQSVLGRNWR